MVKVFSGLILVMALVFLTLWQLVSGTPWTFFGFLTLAVLSVCSII